MRRVGIISGSRLLRHSRYWNRLGRKRRKDRDEENEGKRGEEGQTGRGRANRERKGEHKVRPYRVRMQYIGMIYLSLAATGANERR